MLFSESAAKKYFGTTHAVGQLVKIDTVTYRVAGIMKDAPANSSFQFDMYIPIEAWQSNPSEKKYDLQWGNFNYISFIRFSTHYQTGHHHAKLNKLLDQNRKDNKVTTSLMPLLQLHFDSTVQNPDFAVGNRQSAHIFAILAILILVVACINYVNLTTARASLRSKEVSVRKIVGAPGLPCCPIHGRITAHRTAGLIHHHLPGTAQPALLQPLHRSAVQAADLRRQVLVADHRYPVDRYDPYWHLPCYFIVILQTIESIPRQQPAEAEGCNAEKVLVTTQFTVSVMLIAATLIIYKQLNYINDQTKGGERSQVLTFNVPGAPSKEYPKRKQQAYNEPSNRICNQ